MATVDHLALARAYRGRAATCLISAENTTSSVFSKCYRQLADYYDGLARLEEDFQARQNAHFGDKAPPAVSN
jgi:hypothetical protein